MGERCEGGSSGRQNDTEQQRLPKTHSYATFKQQKRHTAKNGDGEERRSFTNSKEAERKRTRAGGWKPISGSVLCSSIAAGPGHHRRSGFWQETTFWGWFSEIRGGGAPRESGITSCRSTTPTPSRSERQKPYKHKKGFQRVRRKCSTSSFEKLRCNLRRKIK